MSVPSFLLILGVILVLQATIVDFIAIFGITPDLIMMFAIFIGFLNGQREGAFFGFACGLAMDLFGGSYIGLNAVVMMTAGLLAGVCGKRLYKENSLIVMAVTFLCAGAALMVSYILLQFLGVGVPVIQAFTQIILPTALYTSLLVPVFYLRFFRSLIVLKSEK